MRVDRQTLMDHSDPFRAMLGGAFAEAKQDTVTIEEEAVEAVELWFRVLHKSLLESSHTVEIEVVWHAIQFSRNYLIHLEKLEAWFGIYWGKLDASGLDQEDLEQLLYPSYTLDNAAAFAFITKRLVHESRGHIAEHNPTRHRDLHVQFRVLSRSSPLIILQNVRVIEISFLGAMNAAKGSMRKDIVKALFSPLEKFCSAGCAVKAQSLESYIEGVKRTGVWPLETMPQNSIQKFLNSPGVLKWEAKVPEGACISCIKQLRGHHITKMPEEIKEYWVGLCLDCMDTSKPKTDCLTRDWARDEQQEFDWSEDCRIRHGRNTVYFSYMARPDFRSTFTEQQQDRKKAAKKRNYDSKAR